MARGKTKILRQIESRGQSKEQEETKLELVFDCSDAKRLHIDLDLLGSLHERLFTIHQRRCRRRMHAVPLGPLALVEYLPRFGFALQRFRLRSDHADDCMQHRAPSWQ